jgi:hypothetical protein
MTAPTTRRGGREARGGRAIRRPPPPALRRLSIPNDGDTQLTIDGRAVRLTNLGKIFWPDEEEVERGVRIEDFTMRNVPDRIRQLGDLWKPLLSDSDRFALDTML